MINWEKDERPGKPHGRLPCAARSALDALVLRMIGLQ